MARIPYLPFVSVAGVANGLKCVIDSRILQMGDFTTMLLYAIPIIYLDSLRYDRKSIPGRNVDAMRLAIGVLQHFDHPAAEVCKVSTSPIAKVVVDKADWPKSTVLIGHGPGPFRQLHASPRVVKSQHAATIQQYGQSCRQ